MKMDELIFWAGWLGLILKYGIQSKFGVGLRVQEAVRHSDGSRQTNYGSH
jgi:hypothetical protein